LPVVGKLTSRTTKWIRSRWERTRILRLPRMIDRSIDREDATIVQIGSNDGTHGDPINDLIQRRSGWRVLFVEPVPYLFERLKKNYGNEDRFHFERAAINNGEDAIFYWVSPDAKRDIPDLPMWWDQLGSFNINHITKHLDGRLAPYIVATRTPGLTLGELLEKHSIDRLDLLHVDAEGHDWTILKQLDLNRFKPRVILFEHAHLSDLDKESALSFLLPAYDVTRVGPDYLATRRRLLSTRFSFARRLGLDEASSV
jgi:FkbM family methyltransferase